MKDGYFCNRQAIPEVPAIRAEFVDLFDYASRQRGAGRPIRTDDDIIRMYREDRDTWVMAYDKLRFLPSVHSLIGHPLVGQTLTDCGVRRPLLSARLIVRADMPDDRKWDFPTHQDFPYNLGSMNSVTVWVPFQDTAETDGALRIAPASHRAGVYDHEDGILKDAAPFADMVALPMKAGEILCFSQFLVHSSGENRGNRVRFSLQLRFSDLEDPYFVRARWLLNRNNGTVPFEEIDPAIRVRD